jgi:hypothetical protein
MDAGLIERIEGGADRGAAALFAAAVAFAAYRLILAAGVQPQLGFWAAGAGALAYLPCSRLLALAGDRAAPFVLPAFAIADPEFGELPEPLLLTDRFAAPVELLLTERLEPAGELVLTDAQRVVAVGPCAEEAPLVLDDILAEIGPEARVVRLFDRRAMPAPELTPGQLQSRIADRLGNGAPLSAPFNMAEAPDASQALSAALAELRRSLR